MRPTSRTGTQVGHIDPVIHYEVFIDQRIKATPLEWPDFGEHWIPFAKYMNSTVCGEALGIAIRRLAGWIPFRGSVKFSLTNTKLCRTAAVGSIVRLGTRAIRR